MMEHSEIRTVSHEPSFVSFYLYQSIVVIIQKFGDYVNLQLVNYLYFCTENAFFL